MKIAFDYDIFFNQFYGGISRYFVCLMDHLSRLNSDVAVFAPYYNNIYLKNMPDKMVHGSYIQDVYGVKKRFLRIYNQVIGTIQISHWKPEVVHATYYNNRTIMGLDSQSVVTVHDMIHELFPSDFSFLDKTSSKKYLAVEKAKHVICVSEKTKQDLIDLFKVPDEKISVVYHGYEQFNKVEVDFNFLKNTTRPFLLFVGKRNGYKNFIRLVESFSASNVLKKQFDIIAFGGGVFSDFERAFFREKAIPEGRIRNILGGDAILKGLYRKASAFICPSLYEGFGMPTLEAMEQGCPVICSNTGALPEIVGSAGTYFDPRKNESISNAIESIVLSNDKAKEQIKKGLQHLKKYSWEKCARETLNIYNNIIIEK